MAENRLKKRWQKLVQILLAHLVQKGQRIFRSLLNAIQILRHQIFLLIRVNIVTWLECRFSSGDTH